VTDYAPGVERTAWTDERLDDLSRKMDAGFERVDADLRELRVELREGLAGVRSGLGGEIADLRITLLRVGGGIMVGLVGVIAAVLAGG
jgi:hypothetical protein